MKRVMIVGGSGSGKSTLAVRLGALTALPVHHMDQIQWKAGWFSRDRAERARMALAVEAGESWIFEGGFSDTWNHRLARCDTVIWLDLPVGLRLRRVIWRTLRYLGRQRPDMAPGCREGINRQTLPFFRWIWETRHTGREKNTALVAHLPAHVTVVHLTSPQAVAGYLERVARDVM